MATRKKPIEISASDLKNGWHEFLNRVSQERQELVVTRYGHPIARLSPYEAPETAKGIFGSLAGSVTIHGDIVAPIDDRWEADG
jgi:prevent-host-death family protein